jgi:hypothetical protein
MITHLTIRLRQRIQDWIRREIIDFDPYDLEDASPVVVRAQQSSDKSFALTK